MNQAEWGTERSLTGLSTDEVRQSYLAQIPAGRFCTPDDVGAAVAYLAGPGAGFVTGSPSASTAERSSIDAISSRGTRREHPCANR